MKILEWANEILGKAYQETVQHHMDKVKQSRKISTVVEKTTEHYSSTELAQTSEIGIQNEMYYLIESS